VPPLQRRIDPERVDAVARAVPHVERRFGDREPADQGLRGVADDQERDIALIDQITTVSAHLEGVGDASLVPGTICALS
jgi:hypothetical protein